MKCSECENETINNFVQLCEECLVKVITSNKEFWRTHKLVQIKRGVYEFQDGMGEEI